MRKILFVMPALYGGGAEKSLVNLLNLIDYKKYAVDLLLFKQEGLFLTDSNSQGGTIVTAYVLTTVCL